MNRLTSAQMDAIAQAAPSLKGRLENAYIGKLSPRQAIHTMCIVCMGGDRREVPGCTAPACPLWAYRKGA